jgi:inosine-uridine nucleoside N-ribohydrolase
MALGAPGVELEMVSVVAGNTDVDLGVSCARAVLGHAGEFARPVPVYRGSAGPLVAAAEARRFRREQERRQRSEEARKYWAGAAPVETGRATSEVFAPTAMAGCVLAHPGEVTVVAVGPLTNVAIALLSEPGMGSALRDLVVVGGVISLPGGEPELNFGYDPEAAQIVLDRMRRVILVPVDLSITTRFSQSDCARLSDCESELTTYLAGTVAPWIAYLGERPEFEDGCPLHDPLALAVALDLSWVSHERAFVRVELDGQRPRGGRVTCGGPELDGGREVTLVTKADNRELVGRVLGYLCCQSPETFPLQTE